MDYGTEPIILHGTYYVHYNPNKVTTLLYGQAKECIKNWPLWSTNILWKIQFCVQKPHMALEMLTLPLCKTNVITIWHGFSVSYEFFKIY